MNDELTSVISMVWFVWRKSCSSASFWMNNKNIGPRAIWSSSKTPNQFLVERYEIQIAMRFIASDVPNFVPVVKLIVPYKYFVPCPIHMVIFRLFLASISLQNLCMNSIDYINLLNEFDIIPVEIIIHGIFHLAQDKQVCNHELVCGSLATNQKHN